MFKIEFKKLLDSFYSLLFPYNCPGCKILLPYPECICSSCRSQLQWISQPICRKCGIPFPPEWKVKCCAECSNTRRPYTWMRSAYLYEGLVRKMIRSAKYAHHGRVLRFFAEQMVELAPSSPLEAIVAVPLHRSREWERTYNQSALLAQGLSGLLGIPVSKCLYRIKKTVPQSSLSGMARRVNLKKAFAVRKPVPQRVLLVDDVCTTGTTLLECCRALRGSGVKRIYVLTIARAVKKNI